VSKPDWREPLAVVEVNLDIENEDAAEEATHVELRAVTEMMHKEKMVPPVYAASLTSNGVACLYVFEQRACGEGHVVAVHEPQLLGPLLPIDYLLIDAEDRTARIIIREREGS
jgi:hypothetical protein